MNAISRTTSQFSRQLWNRRCRPVCRRRATSPLTGLPIAKSVEAQPFTAQVKRIEAIDSGVPSDQKPRR
jgi:hypothetical protein